MLWSVIPSPARETKSKDPIHLLSSRMNVFYFKVDRELIGGEIEIYTQEGVKLLTQKVQRRKILIDFYYENPGKYIIQFSKGEIKRDFNFVKTDPCPESDKGTQQIMIIQGV